MKNYAIIHYIRRKMAIILRYFQYSDKLDEGQKTKFDYCIKWIKKEGVSKGIGGKKLGHFWWQRMIMNFDTLNEKLQEMETAKKCQRAQTY